MCYIDIFDDELDDYDDEEELYHYGTPRHSGRYPWGSGENPYQHNCEFLRKVNEMHKDGKTEKEIAESFGLSINQLRDRKTIAKAEVKRTQIDQALRLVNEKGYSISKASTMLNVPERTLNTWINNADKYRDNIVLKTSDTLKREVDNKKYIDISDGVEIGLGITDVNLRAAAEKLIKDEGYTKYKIKVMQQTNPGQNTTLNVLAAPGLPRPDYSEIKTIQSYSGDGGKTWNDFKYPVSIDSKRVAVKYAEDGGIDMDGTMLLRRGVEDISLGGSEYAQVRIAVDNTHYLKGMAMYGNDSDFPKGVDIVFNTNKSKDVPMMGDTKDNTVLKMLKNDPDNPFGAVTKANGQSYYIDKDGNEKMRVINKIKEEGDWDDHSRTLATQFLSKQPERLIRTQINLSIAEKEEELDSLMKLTNPEVKGYLLNKFADGCDSASVHMKTAALPGQATKVLLPCPNLKDDECYCPSYPNGTKLALVRFPHGSTSEIPVLKVNNNNPEGEAIFGKNPRMTDAIGINGKAAVQLSGADYDGDFVLTIPTGKGGVSIEHRPQLEELLPENFSPFEQYKKYPGMKVMNRREHGMQMGIVSNLLTDMTLQGAPDEHVARALKHSMVVVDAEKHELDWKKSELENGINELKQIYQKKEGGRYGGSSSLISRARSPVRLPRIKRYRIDPETGRKIPIYDTETFIGRKGDIVTPTKEYEALSVHEDARELLSSFNNPKEIAYAEYSNALKSIGNKARLAMINTGRTAKDPVAVKEYEQEANSLIEKLNKAKANAPRERQAQLKTATEIRKKIIENGWNKDDPGDKKEIKKARAILLTKSRAEFGVNGKELRIDFTDREWEAVNKGAISSTRFQEILKYSDLDKLRERATPREALKINDTKIARMQRMRDSGFTIAEIAETLGFSSSTISSYLRK